MCHCNPDIRTPFCGRGNCAWPKQATCGCRDREDIPHALNCPERPVTDEEISNLSKHCTCYDAIRPDGSRGVHDTWCLKILKPRILARFKVDREMISDLEIRAEQAEAKVAAV